MKALRFRGATTGARSIAQALAEGRFSNVEPRMASTRLLKLHRVRKTVLLGVAAVLAALQVPSARPGPDEGYEGPPPEFSTAACDELAQKAGPIIAWARWEQQLPEETVGSVQFHERTPPWVIDRINQWIDDAYHWEVTDDQVSEWARAGGDAAASRAEDLTPLQTMAIWLRRIARQCREQYT